MRENRFGVKLERGGRRADASRPRHSPHDGVEIDNHTLTLSSGRGFPRDGWAGKVFEIYPSVVVRCLG